MNTSAVRQAAPWLPLIVILSVQVQMSFNVNALTISMGPIVAEFETTAGQVGTALVVYSLAVAGLVMFGAKLGSIIGSRNAFMLGTALHGGSMLWMALATDETMMIAAQGLAGVAAAIAVPAFVVLIANNYRGAQQELSLGMLVAAGPASGAVAFLLVGFLSALISWRWTFAGLAVVALVNCALALQLNPVERQRGVRIDWVGAALAASAITLISLGFNNVNAWGLMVAEETAPFDLGGMSPVVFFVIGGVVLVQLFFTWLRRQRESGGPQLFALEVLDSREERSAAISLLVIGGLGPAVNFLIPLYIQIVQGRSTLQTAIAVVPYSLAILVSATFIVRLYPHFAPRQIGRWGFIGVGAGLFLLAYTINNEWGTPLVIIALIIIGLGEGALLTLMFNVLVSASPKELAGHVGALRGTVNNLATGLGTALASVMAVAALSFLLAFHVEENPVIDMELTDELAIDDVDFVSDDDLEIALEDTSATPEQVDEALQINAQARLDALKISFQVLAGLSLLGIVPAGGLPPYRPGELPATSLQRREDEDEAAAPEAALASSKV